MKRIAIFFATMIVVLNLVVATFHGMTHSESHVPLDSWQVWFVQITVYAIPLLTLIRLEYDLSVPKHY
jgi:hypothetical protein